MFHHKSKHVYTFGGGFFMTKIMSTEEFIALQQEEARQIQPQGDDIFNHPPTQNDIDEFFRRFTEMHQLLHETVEYLKRNTYPKETSDIFETVTLYKPGFGRNWIPSRLQRSYMRIACAIPTAINTTSFLGNGIVVTVPAIAPPLFWTVWDWPDQSSFYLDTTATGTAMNIWVRYTQIN
jgi:hypothetical protein